MSLDDYAYEMFNACGIGPDEKGKIEQEVVTE